MPAAQAVKSESHGVFETTQCNWDGMQQLSNGTVLTPATPGTDVPVSLGVSLRERTAMQAGLDPQFELPLAISDLTLLRRSTLENGLVI